MTVSIDTITVGDARHTGISSDSIDMIITSPPYNAGIAYSKYQDSIPHQEYVSLLSDFIVESIRILRPGGRLAINVANVGRSPYIPLNAIIMQLAVRAGLLARGEIIWDKGESGGQSTAWGSWRSASNPVLHDSHEYILVFSKSTYQYGSGNSTIGGDDFIKYVKSVWHVQTESAERVGHPAPFPIELPYRLIQLYTYDKDVICDPFCGSGSTVLAAIRANRHYIALDIDASYVKLAQWRVTRGVQLEM